MNKKQKQLIGIVAAVVVVVILIIVFFGKGSSNISTNKINLATLNEKEKYAMFEAEFACKLMSMRDNNYEDFDGSEFIQQTLQAIDEVNEKYDYTMSEIEANRVKYATDTEFQELARDYAFEICPEIASELSIDLD